MGPQHVGVQQNIVILSCLLILIPLAAAARVKCGEDAGCFDDCATDCSFWVYWRENGTSVMYHMETLVAGPDAWITLSFSDDTTMGDDYVFGCMLDSTSGNVTLISGKTDGNKLFDTIADDEVTLTMGEESNSELVCEIHRPISGNNQTSRLDSQLKLTYFFSKGDSFTENSFKSDTTSRNVKSTQPLVSNSMNVDTGPKRKEVGIVAPDAYCGLTKGCLTECDSISSCHFLVTWVEEGDSVTYTLSVPEVGRSTWVLLDFSEDRGMKNDYVMGCRALEDGTVLPFTGKTPDRKSKPAYIPDNEVKLESYTLTDNVLSCTLKRPIAAKESVNRTVTSQNYYYLVAKGAVDSYDSTILLYHGGNKIKSNEQLNSASKAYEGAPVLSKITKDPECGVFKGCFFHCESDNSCSFLVTWQEVEDQIRFHVATPVSSTTAAWTAIGFSSDGSMGDDSVTGYTEDDTGRVKFYNSYNEGTSSNFIQSKGITLLHRSFANGYLSFTFLRDKFVPGESKMFDLNEPWVLMVAYGSASFSGNSDPVLSEHTNHYASSSAIRFNETTIAELGEDDEPLVIAHGCLMVGAWIFFASIGVVVARHCKPVWLELMFSKQVWFQIHRFCMVFVLLATVAGFVCIFVEEKGWSDIHSDDEYLEAHPILGVIVAALTIVNPIMALFRPNPGTSKRFIFNWAHLIVGEAAHILGVITVFFGIELYDDVHDNTIYVLWAYVAWQIFVEVLLYIVQFTCKPKKSEAYEMETDDQQASPKVQHSDGSSNQGNTIKKVILVLHFFVVTSISAIVMTLLAHGK